MRLVTAKEYCWYWKEGADYVTAECEQRPGDLVRRGGRQVIPLQQHAAYLFIVGNDSKKLYRFVCFMNNWIFYILFCIWDVVTVLTRRAADGRQLGGNIQRGYMWRRRFVCVEGKGGR